MKDFANPHQSVFKIFLFLELVEDEDSLPSSPGKVMHYFASFNYLNGLRTLLGEDFKVSPRVLNKHKIAPLWIAAQNNFTDAATILLEFSSDTHLQVRLFIKFLSFIV